MRLVKRLRRLSKDVRGLIVTTKPYKEPKWSNPAIFLALSVFIILIATAVVLHITISKQKASQKAVLPIMRLGLTEWPGYAPIYVGLEKGIFRSYGVDVRYNKYSSFKQESNDYVSGKLDARGNLISDALVESDSGFKQKIILALDYSNGADALLAQNNIAGVAQLKGKRVAYEPGTVSEFFLRHILQRYNLTINDIKSVPASADATPALLANHHADAAMTSEPFITKLIQQGGVRVLFSSAQSPHFIVDVLSVRADYLSSHSDAASRFVKGYFASLSYVQNHPQETVSIMSKVLNLSQNDASNNLAEVQFLNLTDNAEAFTFAAGDQSLYTILRERESSLQSAGQLINTTTDTDSIMEPAYIRQNVRH